MDPQPLSNYEWHLYEYELNKCDVCVLYRLEFKFIDSKKSSKTKVMNDSLLDLQQQMYMMIAQVMSQKIHFNTFGGNPVCLAGGHEVLKVIDKEKRQSCSAIVDSHLVDRLTALQRNMKGIHVVNLGDNGFIVVRDGCTIFRSPIQQHDFNVPYQLESGNGSDLPSSAQM